MGVAGAPEAQVDHAERIADFALDILKEAENVMSPATGQPLQVNLSLSGLVSPGKPVTVWSCRVNLSLFGLVLQGKPVSAYSGLAA